MKNCLVLGAGGFIGSNLVKKLKSQGDWVRGVDLKYNEFEKSIADEFVIGDLRDRMFTESVFRLNSGGNWSFLSDPFEQLIEFDEVYQLAADMGGANLVFSKEYDADIMHNSAQINLNVCESAVKYPVRKIFYSSSACIYPEYAQLEPNNKGLKESDALPFQADSNYGLEKYFSENLYDAYRRNKGLNVRIARFHNIYGELGTIEPLRSKSPAAICVKVASGRDGDSIEIMGSGLQSRSFLYIEECLTGVELLMKSNYYKPINIGSSESISINELAEMVIQISGKNLKIKNIDSNNIGVMGRNSDNTLIKEVLGWAPNKSLREGMENLYFWVEKQINEINSFNNMAQSK